MEHCLFLFHNVLPRLQMSLRVCLVVTVCSVLTIQCAEPILPKKQVDRGLMALPKAKGNVYISWRLLQTDPTDIAFNLYRMDRYVGDFIQVNDCPLTQSTNFLDTTAVDQHAYWYLLKAIRNGREERRGATTYVLAQSWEKPFRSIYFSGEYEARMAGIADINGDGVLDYVIKQPNFNTDPYSNPGYWKRSKETYTLEAYDGVDGKLLWQYDMGWAIETGTWYSPYLVYDIDGDGSAEVYVKSGDGDPREWDGRVLNGPEYLAKLDGRTGRMLRKIDWLDRREFNTYNRASRNFLTLAYLDGQQPSLIMQRGTYDIIKTLALDKHLQTVWYWEAKGRDEGFQSQGGHGLISADVDADGRDELVMGSAVLDDNGTGLWTSGLGHPDVCFVADIDPRRPGLEIFFGIEPRRQSQGVCMADARTGEIIWSYDGPTRHVHSMGMLGDIDPNHPGMEGYAGEQDGSQYWLYAADGQRISDISFGTLAPLAVWWDADQTKEVVARNEVFKYAGESLKTIEGRVLTAADIMGDWREEIITTLPGELRIYSTTTLADTRRTWLMQDRQYRVGVAAGTMGYYRQPKLGGIAMGNE
jgi:rhamnogalacturonan endolyase